jgi:hypothetical protein
MNDNNSNQFEVGKVYTDGWDEFKCIHHDPDNSGAILIVSKDNQDDGQRNGVSSKVYDHLIVNDKSELGGLSLHVYEVFLRQEDEIQNAISYIEESRDNEVDSKYTENILEDLNNQLEPHPRFIEVK